MAVGCAGAWAVDLARRRGSGNTGQWRAVALLRWHAGAAALGSGDVRWRAGPSMVALGVAVAHVSRGAGSCGGPGARGGGDVG